MEYKSETESVKNSLPLSGVTWNASIWAPRLWMTALRNWVLEYAPLSYMYLSTHALIRRNAVSVEIFCEFCSSFWITVMSRVYICAELTTMSLFPNFDVPKSITFQVLHFPAIGFCGPSFSSPANSAPPVAYSFIVRVNMEPYRFDICRSRPDEPNILMCFCHITCCLPKVGSLLSLSFS